MEDFYNYYCYYELFNLSFTYLFSFVCISNPLHFSTAFGNGTHCGFHINIMSWCNDKLGDEQMMWYSLCTRFLRRAT